MDIKRVFSEAYDTITENMQRFEQTDSIQERIKITVIQQLIY
jgi:hypothetical protein